MRKKLEITTQDKREIRKGLKRLIPQKKIAERLQLSPVVVCKVKAELEKRSPITK